nr:flagellar hook-associated protein FlgK [Lachnospiraceae bacterium]
DKDGNRTDKVIYVYNEEDPNERDSLYSLNNINVNKDVVENPALIPHRHQSDTPDKMGGAIAYDVAEKIYELWETEDYTLNPSDVTPCSFENFYTKFCGELANRGSVQKTTEESLRATKEQVNSRRQEVIGVNTDEELQNMIKYQNAYNASSRYINVVSQMIEYLLTSV